MSIHTYPEVARELESRLHDTEQEFDQVEKHVELLIRDNDRLRKEIAKGEAAIAYLLETCRSTLKWLDQAMPKELPGLKAYLAHCIDHAEGNAP